mgnify:CR=1 FL=1
MSKYIDSAYSALKEYVPGEQPKDKKYIKLNTNESPYPPSPSVIKAVNSEEVADLRLYSDPESSKVKKAIAEVYGVDSKNVFVSNGSDEILNFAFMVYGKINGALFPEISYGFYKVFCDLYGIEKTMVPLEEDFTIDKNKYMNTGKFTVIANPNAPTGIEMDKTDIEEIIASNKGNVVLIDEAYIDFGGTSCYELINKYDNLIVCRTFSKSYSLAGARLGYCFANEELIKDLEKIKYSTNPYNINRLTMIAGEAAIDSNSYYMENCKKICETREYTTKELEKMGFEVIPSKTNFVFAKHNNIDGGKIYEELKASGVLVRHFTSERICQYNRITIGTKEQMDILLTKLKNIVRG